MKDKKRQQKRSTVRQLAKAQCPTLKHRQHKALRVGRQQKEKL